MAVDLGAVVGRVVLEDAEFQRTVVRVRRTMVDLGSGASKAASGTGALDEGLGAVSASATNAATSIGRTAKAIADASGVEQKAAASAQRHAQAVVDVAAAMSRTAAATDREQQAFLRLIAAEERLNTVQESGKASTAQLAGAYSSLIGAERSLSRAQSDAAGTTTTLTDAMARQAAAAERIAGIMASVSGASAKEQQQALRSVAAQERLAAASAEAGSAERAQAVETAKLATAQSSVLGAQERLTVAQREAAVATTGLAASQREAAVASRGLTGGMAGTLKMAGELGLVFGAFELAKKALDIGKEAGDFQQKMLLIQTNAGKSAAEVKDMSAAVLRMAGPLATAPDKLADALYHVEQNGLHGKDALAALTVGAEGAKIGIADVEDTTNTMTIAMASGIHGVKNLQQAMGFMIATVGTGDMRLKDLNEALSGGILSTAKGFGVSLRDVAAVLATLGDNGIRGANAATALRMTMMGFAAPAKGGADALRSVGLGMTDLQKAMETHGLVYAMNDLEKHMTAAGVTGGKVGAFITQAFGKRAGAGVGVLMGEIDRLNIKYSEAEKGAQSFGARWAATTKTAKFQFQELSAGVQAEGVQMASAALPLASIVAGQLGGALHDVIHLGAQVGPAFVPEFKLAGAAIGAAAFALHGIAATLAAVGPELKVVAVAAAALWAGMKVGQLVTAGITAIGEVFAALQIKAVNAQIAISEGWAGMGVAATESAATTAAAAATVAAEADTAAAAVDTAGETARIGWAGLAGPLGAAALGIFAIVSMFHHSSAASKEATDAAKAYTDALSSGGGQSTLVDAITKQLSDNGVPAALKKYNAGIASSGKQWQVSGKDMVTAIQSQGKPLADLQNKLARVAITGGGNSPAYKLLKSLKDQSLGLSDAVKKDLSDTKTFAGVSTAIQKTTVATKLGSDAAKQYATMAGLIVDKNGVVAASQTAVNAAVNGVSDAYDKATAAGTDFLAGLDTFSKSAGTASDRAALIGSILKANAGDALSYASTMNAAATATHQLGTDIASAAKSVGKSGESTRAYLDSIVNLKTGSINYSKTAAAPLISNLQSIQTAAINAASATYQHERATMGAGKASQDAVMQYQGVESSLETQLQKLGLTKDAARKLTEQYLGVPKNVKTLIQQAGANPVVTVLNKIGTLLAKLTGQEWDVTVGANISPATRKLQALGAAIRAAGGTAQGAKNAQGIAGIATGGALPEGLAAVGEDGPELTVKRGPNVQVIPHGPARRVAAHLGAAGINVPGFASGTGNYAAVAAALLKLGATRAGIAGFLGSTKIESHGSTTAHNSRENAWGLQQWEGGRLTSLKALAAKMGVSFKSQTAQVAMITKELTHGYGDTLKVLRTATWATKAAAYVDAHYEVSSGDARKARENAAVSFYRQLGKGGKLSGATSTAAAAKAIPVVSTKAIMSALFGKGGTFATQLIGSVHNSLTKGITTTSGTAAAARAAVATHSAAVVNGAIAGGVAPDPTQAQLIASLPGQITKAVGKEQGAEIAGKNVTKLAANVATLKTRIASLTGTTRADIETARTHATALSNTAHAAMRAAEAMATGTKAQRAAKKSALEHARALADDARAASQNATALARASVDSKAALKAQLTAAQAVAAAAKTAYGNLSQAAKDAASKAADTAKSLVASIQSDADAMTSAITDFKTSMASGIAGDSSIATLWGQLTGADDADGNPITATLSALQGNLNAILAQAQTFAGDLNKVVAEGGNQDLITQLTSLGATAGDALAQQLITAGPAAVAALQATMTSISSLAGTEAQQLASSFYGPGATAMIQFVTGLESQFPALTAALQSIVNAVAAAAGVDPTKITTPKTTTGAGSKTSSPATATKGTAGSGAGKTAHPGLSIPKFAAGVTNFLGGLARVHRDELLVNLPRGTDVIPAGNTNRIKHPTMTAAPTLDMGPVVRRLESIERTIAATPAQNGQHVGQATLGGFRAAGAADRRQALRAGRRAVR